MSDNPLSGTVSLDVTNYKAGITELNRQIKVIETGFKASAAAMGDWDKSSVGMESRIKTLTSSIALQQQKVDGLNRVYKEMAAGGKASAKELENLQIKTNLETERLNKMKGELETDTQALGAMGNESTQTGKKTGDLTSGEDKAEKSTNKLGAALNTLKNGLKTVGTGVANVVKDIAKLTAGMAIGLMGAVAGVVAGLGAMIVNTLTYGDDIEKMSQKTGLSVQHLQELKFIADQSGTSVDDLATMMSRLTRNMESATKWSSSAFQGFYQLGIKTRDAKGQLRDATVVFGEALTALGKIPDETKRNALAMLIFGKSAAELEPMMQLSGDSMANLTQQAHDMGAVMSDKDVKAASDLKDKLTGLKDGLAGTAMTVVSAFLPALTGIAGVGQDFMQKFASALKDPKDPQKAVAAVAGSLILVILEYIARDAPKMFESATKIIESLISGIQTMMPKLMPVAVLVVRNLVKFLVQNIPILLKMGIDIVSALILGLVDQLPAIFNMGGQVFLMLLNGIVALLPTLLQTGLQMLTNILTGITAALPTIVPVITDVITQIVYILTTNLPALINAAMLLVTALAQGIGAALPTLTPALVGLVGMVILVLAQNLPLLITAGLQLLGALAQGIMLALPLLATMALQILVTLVSGIVTSLPTILSAAYQILMALGTGLKNMADQILLPAGKQMLDTFVKAIKSVLDKGKDMLEIGKKIVDGLWQGIKAQAKDITDKITKFFTDIIAAVKKALGIPGSPSEVFTQIGMNMMAGLGAGFDNQFSRVKRDITAAMKSLGDPAGLAWVGAGAGAGKAGAGSVSSETYNFYAPVTLAGTAGQSLTGTIQAKRY